MPPSIGWLVLQIASELRDRLKLSDHPTVCSRRHQDDIVHNGMLTVNGLAPVENLEIIFRCIMQLDDITHWSVEHCIEFVTLIEISGRDSVLFLAPDCLVQGRVRRTDK